VLYPSGSLLRVNGEANYPSLEGRRVLVTGGASGIGAEMVRGFARNGAQVAVLDIDREAGEAVAEEHAPRVRFVECDLSDVVALRAAVEEVGPVTILINNAADDQRYAFEDITPEQWDATQAVNLRHQFFMAQAVVPGMRAAGGGSIVNLSSVAWRRGPSGMLAYATAKAGVVGLTNALATALGGDRIRVNAIAPGAVMTPRQMRLWHTPESRARLVAAQAIPRDVTECDIAAAALFLAADDSGMITRQCLYVDGGLS
jgi:NAD(P)-dependent dehydrogenase (short-subunit alcohol dehydrogenase family)